jgi:hypothetical protein
VTLSASGAEWLNAPDFPAIETVEVPFAAVFATDRVRTLEPAVPAGLNTAVTPEGSPDTENASIPANPLTPATLIVADPTVPWGMLRLPGLTVIE